MIRAKNPSMATPNLNIQQLPEELITNEMQIHRKKQGNNDHTRLISYSMTNQITLPQALIIKQISREKKGK